MIRVTKAQPKLKKVMGSNQENQDSLSCFQESQETESWPNFAVWSDFKNQENQDFKSWKPWSKKPNLAAKVHWISVTSINDPISVGDGLQAQVLEGKAQ